jgi:hypothetical protein
LWQVLFRRKAKAIRYRNRDLDDAIEVANDDSERDIERILVAAQLNLLAHVPVEALQREALTRQAVRSLLKCAVASDEIPLAHPLDEVPDLVVDLGAATTSAGLPPPIVPKAAPMPPDNGFAFCVSR